MQQHSSASHRLRRNRDVSPKGYPLRVELSRGGLAVTEMLLFGVQY